MKRPYSKAVIGGMTMLLLLSGCAAVFVELPASDLKEIVNADDHPHSQWDYCGSDRDFHYFKRHVSYALTPSSGKAFYKVPLEDYSVPEEFYQAYAPGKAGTVLSFCLFSTNKNIGYVHDFDVGIRGHASRNPAPRIER